MRALSAPRGSLIGTVLLAVAAALLFWQPSGDSGAAPTGAESPAATSDAAPVSAFVTRAVDGDTIEIRLEGRTEDVRYIGVDTPETVKPGAPVGCFGHQASNFNHALVEHHRVRLEFDAERRDIYGRLLAYVHLGKRFVNADLVRLGFARSLTIPPNDTHAPLFHRLERRAARGGRGLWAACSP